MLLKHIYPFRYFLFFSILVVSACHLDSVPVGYQRLGIHLDEDYQDVYKKLGKLKVDVNGMNQNNLSVDDYLHIPDPIRLEGIDLNPILYLSFIDQKLISFTVSYTIDTPQLDLLKMETLLKKLSNNELPGLKDLLDSNRQNIQDHEHLYLKFYEVDTLEGYFNHIRYSIRAIP